VIVRALQQFNDFAVGALSHPLVVALWWLASGASLVVTAISPSMIAATLALSFLALAYGSAIAERQLRTEGTDKARDVALHKKIDALLVGVPEADEELAGSEPVAS
jgi:hypothetical protein